MSAISSPLSLGEAIIRTLKSYGDVSIDFLARVSNRRVFEVQEYISVLEREGVVTRKGEKGETISLVAEKQ